jgi:cell division protein FtsL
MAGWLTQKKNVTDWMQPVLAAQAQQQKQIEEINHIMSVVTVVVVLMTAALIVMVIGLFLDVSRDRINSYQALKAKTEDTARNQESAISNQNTEIEALKQKITDLSWLISQQTKALQNQ